MKKKVAKNFDKLKTPIKLGQLIDKIQLIQERASEFEAKANALKSEASTLLEEVQNKFKKDALIGAMGRLGRTELREDDVPDLEDYEAFCNYVRKEDAFDLFQKRVSSEAARLRWAEGKTIPGVAKFHRVVLKVKARKAK